MLNFCNSCCAEFACHLIPCLRSEMLPNQLDPREHLLSVCCLDSCLWQGVKLAPTPTHARKLRSHKHARRRTGFKRTGGATTQHERGFVARSTCLGLGLRERGPLGLGGREVHGRGLSRPRVRFCSALGVDGVACGSVAAHPEPANATTTLNAERIDVRVSGRPRESLLVGRRRSGHRVSRRPGQGLS